MLYIIIFQFDPLWTDYLPCSWDCVCVSVCLILQVRVIMTQTSRCMYSVAAHRAVVMLHLMTCGDSTWTAKSGYGRSLQVHACTYCHSAVKISHTNTDIFLLVEHDLESLTETHFESWLWSLCVQVRTRLLKPVPRWWCLRTYWCCSEAGPAPVPTLCTNLSDSLMRYTPTLLPKTGAQRKFITIISNVPCCLSQILHQGKKNADADDIYSKGLFRGACTLGHDSRFSKNIDLVKSS